MADGCLPACDISRDVKNFKPAGAALRAKVVSAGFPCQACRVIAGQNSMSRVLLLCACRALACREYHRQENSEALKTQGLC